MLTYSTVKFWIFCWCHFVLWWIRIILSKSCYFGLRSHFISLKTLALSFLISLKTLGYSIPTLIFLKTVTSSIPTVLSLHNGDTITNPYDIALISLKNNFNNYFASIAENNIPYRLLFLLKNEIPKPLVDLVNLSFMNGVFLLWSKLQKWFLFLRKIQN